MNDYIDTRDGFYEAVADRISTRANDARRRADLNLRKGHDYVGRI